MRTGERIAERRNELGLSQTQLAQRAGVSQATIAKLESGISSGSSQIHRIARVLQTTAEYLTGDTKDPTLGAPIAPSPQMIAEQLGMTLIPQIDLHFALGGGSFVEGHVNTTMVPHRTDWLNHITRGKPADIFLTKGDGDSMIPTIMDGDDIIVNRSERIIDKQDKIWALGYGDLVSIKRVMRLPNGRYSLNSDNKQVWPVEALEEELRVIGRVIWIGRRM
jgi:phage repressor protein C with HTH and peptisase S24 domain